MTVKDDVVVVAIGVGKGDDGMSVITVGKGLYTFFCHVSQSLLFLAVFYLPCMIEIEPIDIRLYVGKIVCEDVSLHSFLVMLIP